MGLRDDLERRIRDSYDIISQYEETTRTSDRPEEVQRAERKIKEQWERIGADFAKYQMLCQRLGKPLAEDILEIAVMLDADVDSSDEGEAASLHRRLEQARENLRLIRERRSEYVMETDVPLDLVKRERQLEQQIADLEAQSQATNVSREQ